MGTLYVVATPIGNLEDLSPRGIRTLTEVSLIAAEDTRHTGILLKRLGIDTPLVSNHGFNERARVARILDALSGADVALVSDSGTPAISDPGAILVRAAAEAGYPVVPIPGPSAVVAAISASGLVDGPFTFLGFLPRASGERQAMLQRGLESGLPLVIYESGPRVQKLAADLAASAPEREIVVFREISKLHEEAIRGRAEELPSVLATVTLKGEFVVVIGAGSSDVEIDLDTEIRARLQRGERVRDIARVLAKLTHSPGSEIYERAMRMQRDSGS